MGRDGVFFLGGGLCQWEWVTRIEGVNLLFSSGAHLDSSSWQEISKVHGIFRYC
jgi:hypothetical protein